MNNSRVIKYRQLVGGMWHYWGYVDGCFISPITSQEPNPINCHFTGLTDSQGVEIYEGDILEFKRYHNLGHETRLSLASVEWGETGDSDGWSHCKHYEWVVDGNSLADVADSDYDNESYCKVIGNIYANPELLNA